MLPQSAVALLGRLIGSKERDFDLLAFQNIGNQWRDAHMACVESQVNRLGAKRKSLCIKARQSKNQKRAFKNAWHGQASKYRVAIYLP